MNITLTFNTAFVTGAAGFIGSTLVDRLLAMGIRIIGYDNMSSGIGEFLVKARQDERFSFVEGDILDAASLTKAMRGLPRSYFTLPPMPTCVSVWSIRASDLEQNTVGDLQCAGSDARQRHSRHRVFLYRLGLWRSAGHSDPGERAISRSRPRFMAPRSSPAKDLISVLLRRLSACAAWIFRFVSILGESATRMAMCSIFTEAVERSHRLEVLGNGRQRKSYLYIQDCIDAIFACARARREKVNIFNLGTDEYCEVNNSIRWITGRLGVSPQLEYSGGDRGWVGDNPFIFLDTGKIRVAGLDAEADYSGGHRANTGLADGKPLGAGAPLVKPACNI